MASQAARVLMLLPRSDFDPSEAALPWLALQQAGHIVDFATPDGQTSRADERMLSGRGLDPWGWIPGLDRVLFIGALLRARRDARVAYEQMIASPGFIQPLAHAEVNDTPYQGLLIPGGHRATGMREFLESPRVQALAACFLASERPLCAICHGVLVLARARAADGRSALYGRRTTALTWALERSAWNLTRFFARFWDPHYYRTYREQPGQPAGSMSVQAEVSRALASPADFLDVAADAAHYLRKTSGLFRDRANDARPAWVVRDRNYLSARWPGDAHTFAQAFVAMLETAGR